MGHGSSETQMVGRAERERMGKEESELPVALKVDERQDTSKTQQSEGGERENRKSE